MTTLVVSVGEFSTRLREVFRRVRAFDYIGVSGEISEWTPRPHGVYFTVKDASAVLQCFAYPNHAAKFPAISPGTAVVAYGTVRIQERRSRYELLVNDVRLTGIGELYAQYEALKERFRSLGLFESARKRPIPVLPHAVVLVSAHGKGAEDFLTTLQKRAPHVRVDFVETRVQGIGADVEIADAIDRAARYDADVIVLARGGGSYEDLFAFNLEPVVRAIVRSRLPVITGIGHTGDRHLADEVADLSCETPSNAAQFIANLWHHGSERLTRLTALLEREMRDILTRAVQRADLVNDALARAWERAVAARQQRLSALERRLTAQSPAARVARRAQRLAVAQSKLSAWPQNAQRAWRSALELRRARLASVDPHAPLERGYALILRGDRLVREVADVSAGDVVHARLRRGGFDARVERIAADE